jgi:hypothetical protein
VIKPACKEADLRMAALSAGQLAEAEGLRLQDHLDRCESCRSRGARISALVSVMRAEEPALSEARLLALERVIRQAPLTAGAAKAASAPPRWVFAAAALLIAAAAFAAAKLARDAARAPLEDGPKVPAPTGLSPGERAPEPPAPKVEAPPAAHHKGAVAKAGDVWLEAAVEAGGEVRVYPYDQAGAPLPPSALELSAIELRHADKPYPVKLSPKKTYFAGALPPKTSLPVGAPVEIRLTAPVVVYGVSYAPEAVLFPAYVVAVPVVVVPAAPAAIEIRPPRIEIGIGVKVGGKVTYAPGYKPYSGKAKHSGKHKGRYKHGKKHSH